MKDVFNTSVGTIEVLLDRDSRTISIYRFDDQGRTIAASIESWDHVFGRREVSDWNQLENAGIALGFVAVLLDALIVLLPLVIVVGLLAGGGYAESRDGYANAGVIVDGKTSLLMLALALGYYVVCEAATGMTLGKRMVGIRVVGEGGEHVTFVAAFVRNLLRVADALFFYLVGFLFAVTSFRGQCLGDRAAHTIVVRLAVIPDPTKRSTA